MAEAGMTTEALGDGNRGACEACHAADTNPYCGLYVGGCIRCQIRYTSQQPRSFREKVLGAISSPELRERFRADMLAEFRRREALKVDRPLQ